LSLLDCI